MKPSSFTAAQIVALRENPYTFSVKGVKIVYTLEFKEYVMSEVAKGQTSVNIFRSAGYDPEVLGKTRIYDFVKRLKKEAASPEGLKEPRAPKRSNRLEETDLSKQKTSAAIRELQEQVIYLQQELEFLKKTSALRNRYKK